MASLLRLYSEVHVFAIFACPFSSLTITFLQCMSHEYEAKFLRVEPDDVRRRLREADATLTHPERLMKRRTFDHADLSLRAMGAWVRVRDEGDKVTMSYKRIAAETMEGMSEVMVVVDDFERACDFLQSVGLVETSFQENRRETWMLQGCEVVIDWWPWILPLVEIEGASEREIHLVSDLLGFDWSRKVHGGIEPAYQDGYTISAQAIKELASITFTAPPIALLACKK